MGNSIWPYCRTTLNIYTFYRTPFFEAFHTHKTTMAKAQSQRYQGTPVSLPSSLDNCSTFVRSPPRSTRENASKMHMTCAGCKKEITRRNHLFAGLSARFVEGYCKVRLLDLTQIGKRLVTTESVCLWSFQVMPIPLHNKQPLTTVRPCMASNFRIRTTAASTTGAVCASRDLAPNSCATSMPCVCF